MPQNGRYEITTNDTGVYVSVWGPANGGMPVSTASIVQDLLGRNCKDFDRAFIGTVIREAIGKPVLIVNSQDAVDGRYEITANDTGIYVSVWSPANGGVPVRKSDIIQNLLERHCRDFDRDFIGRVIHEAIGQPVLVAYSVPEAPVMPHIRVKVRPDHMEARIDVAVPPGALPVTREMLLNRLKEEGVVYGIDESVLEHLVVTGAGKNILCASGTFSVSGTDACLAYHVDPDSQGKPVELEDGRVDFKDIHSFLCVERGQVLAEKIPATPGIPGTDVFGLPVPAKPGRDLRLPAGKNVVVAGNRLLAAIDGHLQALAGRRMEVVPVIRIDGDVDYSTGNIDFKGSVIINGSIQEDFSVKAGGNVEIFGSICGGMVEGQSILIHKGIQGMKKSIIKARERLVANFIENATVYADREIFIGDVVLNSSVFAGSRVVIEGKRGLVRGGRISAGEEIRAVTVGNPSGVNTEVEVALNPFLKDELLTLEMERKKTDALYETINSSLAYIRNQGAHTDAGKKERYEKYQNDFNDVSERLEAIKQRKAGIEQLLYSLKPGRVRVSGFLHQGTRVSIGSVTKNVTDPQQFVSLYVQDGEIKFVPLR
ncbi:hypothetical protein P22_0910 [Propionispora sp. 2/2-37]|nr:hypothetical protein P22_0910 [Propionispora sp. 2/2-37]